VLNQTVQDNLTVVGDVSCFSNLYVNNNLYLDPSADVFLSGKNGNLGINRTNPQFALDVNAGNNDFVFRAESDNPTAVSVISVNNDAQGFSLETQTTNLTLFFYSETDIYNGLGKNDGMIQYNQGGNLLIEVSNNVFIKPSVTIGNNPQNQPHHQDKETVTIYNTTVQPSSLFPTASTGTALTLVSDSSTSLVFSEWTTPTQQNGIALGGGAFPYESTRKMGLLGWMDNNKNLVPSQTLVSGKNAVKYKSTVGINTVDPLVDRFVFDVNGPQHIGNRQIGKTTVPFQIVSLTKTSASTLGQNINQIVAGFPYKINGSPVTFDQDIAISRDQGQSWNLESIVSRVPLFPFNSVYSYDASFTIMVGGAGYAYYSSDRGNNFYQVELGTLSIPPPNFTHVFVDASFVFLVDTSLNFYWLDDYFEKICFSDCNIFIAIAAYNNFIFYYL
jgi:hypothetical protein